MRDWKIVRFARHNPGLIGALVLCVVMVGCAFLPLKTTSPTDPSKRITEAQLEAEIVQFQANAEAFVARANSSRKELDDKKACIRAAIDQAGTIARSLGVPWTGIGGAVLGGLLLGTAVDNRRKDGLVKKLKVSGISDRLTRSTGPKNGAT